MQTTIQIIGAFIALGGVAALVSPQWLTSLLQNNADRRWLRLSAIWGRLIIGAIFLNYSYQSEHSHVFQILGGIIVLAGLGIAILSRQQFSALINSVITKFEPYFRIAGLLSLGLGVWVISLTT